MARDETKRIAPAVLQADRDSLAGLKTITNYSPANQDYANPVLDAAEAEMLAAQRAETQALAAAAAARDVAVAKEWAFHNKIMGMKDQVIAQHGRSSNEAQTIGRKKPTEVRRRSGKKGS
jgi:hypothetical protein